MRGLVAISTLLAVGCTSVFFERGPSPAGHTDPPVQCSSVAWPVIDAAVAVGLGVSAARCNDPMCGLGDIATIPIAVLSAASSVFGIVEHVRCTRAADRQRFSTP